MEKLDIKKNKPLDLEGPFTLMVVDGYATVYDGNNKEISVLSDLELGWVDSITGEYFTETEEYMMLQCIIDLMNLGWKRARLKLKDKQ